MADNHNLLDKKFLVKEFFSTLFPTSIAMVTHSFYCLADVFFIGKGVGSDGTAALNIALPIFTLFTAIGLLIGVGATTTISVLVGQGNTKDNNKVFTMAVVINLCAGVTLSILGGIFCVPIARFLGATDELLPYVVDYLKPVLVTCFVYIMSAMLQVIIRADRNPKLVMASTITGNVANIGLDYVFVMIFDMGMFGASLATAVGPMVALSMMLLHFKLGKNNISLTKNFWNNTISKRLLKNGIGTCILEISSGIVIFLFNISLLKVSGKGAVAVYTVISNVGYAGKMIFTGIAQSSQPIISRSYGNKNIKNVKLGFRLSLYAAITFSLTTYILLLLFPMQVLSIFITDNPQIIAHNIGSVAIYFSSFVFTAINTMLMYYFQSLEKPKHTLIIAVLRGIVLITACLAILPNIFGENGIWISLTVSEVLTFIIFFPIVFKLEKNLAKTFNKEISDNSDNI